MEILTLSLHNVVSAGLFKGINLHKSKLIGIVVNQSLVEAAASNIGCMAFNLPFTYLEIIIVANKMAHSSLASSLRRNPKGGIVQVQMANLISNLEGFTLLNTHDRWRWSLSGDGEFSVASVRNFIDDRTLAEVCAKTRWIKYVPFKVNILAWIIKLINLPSRLNLSRRGLDLDTIFCPSCNSVVESSNHIFFGCPMVKDLYKFLARRWDVSITTFFPYDEWWNWFSNLRVPSKLKLIFECVFYISWWVIWNYRNKVIFGSGHHSNDRLTDDIVAFSFTWCRS
nr:hypothetical protein [Tanacetum cinerariifolium]